MIRAACDRLDGGGQGDRAAQRDRWSRWTAPTTHGATRRCEERGWSQPRSKTSERGADTPLAHEASGQDTESLGDGTKTLGRRGGGAAQRRAAALRVEYAPVRRRTARSIAAGAVYVLSGDSARDVRSMPPACLDRDRCQARAASHSNDGQKGDSQVDDRIQHDADAVRARKKRAKSW